MYILCCCSHGHWPPISKPIVWKYCMQGFSPLCKPQTWTKYKLGLVTNVTCPAFTDFSWEDQTYAFWGTVDYASVRNLSGYHPTPRDDLEGLACTLLEMATGMSDAMHESTLNMHSLQVFQHLSYLVLNRRSTNTAFPLAAVSASAAYRLVPRAADQPSFATLCR